MKPLAWMSATSAASWALVTAAVQGAAHPEVLLGMAGPLGMAVASWIAYERAHGVAPEYLTNVMVVAFALKVLFFGAYVGVALGVLGLRPVPFVVSFVSYFIALHAMEAVFLRRLVMDDPRVPSRGRA
jgi:hypothetical protein